MGSPVVTIWYEPKHVGVPQGLIRAHRGPTLRSNELTQQGVAPVASTLQSHFSTIHRLR
jgi:hypothetical protein